jgi:hypothetical protein
MESHQPVALPLPPETSLSCATKRTKMRISTKEARRRRKTPLTYCRRALSTMRYPSAAAKTRKAGVLRRQSGREGVEDAAPGRLLQGRPPTKSQILALSKYMQAGPGAYKLTAKMAQGRSAWDALSPGEKVLSDEQHDYDNHRRTHLVVYDEHHSWDIVGIASPTLRATAPSAATSNPRRS